MKKRFIGKRRKKKWKLKFLFFAFIFIFSFYQTFQFLLKSNIKIEDKILVKLLLSKNYNNKMFSNILNNIKENYSPTKLLISNYYDIKIPTNKRKINKDNTSSDYLIYIYNTHQTEEYSSNTFLEEQVRPTVMMDSYIMEDVFNKNGFKTLVEERSIDYILSKNNWKYYKSYDASRIYLEDSKISNPSLKYFIDVHRDSLKKDKTTVVINDKKFAKVIFLVGKENPNYLENLEFMTKINNKIEEKYPNLSKGIYQKGGEGVNGVYNQDNSKYTILIEIGGVDNTIDEVLNSTLAFTECFMEVIRNEK